MSLKRDAIWSAVGTFSLAGLAFAFRLMVAKVLTPDQFGVASIALTIMVVLQVVNDFGLTATLIQKDEDKITPELVNTTFTASFLVSVLLAALTGLAVAPLAADFYHQPGVAPLVAVLALGLLPSPFTTVAAALLYRRRAFKQVAIIRVAANILALGVACTVLLIAPSPWVVIIQSLVASGGSALALIAVAGWRFRPLLKVAYLKEMFGFSSFILASDLMVSFIANAGVFIVGRLLSTADAGLYALATYMTDAVRRSLMAILNRVTFVHFSQLKHDKPKLARTYVSTVTWNCRAIFPAMMVFMLFGPQLMTHFYGDRWDGVGSVIRWLSFSVLIGAAGGATSNLYKAMGRPGLDLALFVGTTVFLLLPGMVAGGMLGGIGGIAMAAAGTNFVAIALRQFMLERLVGGTAKPLARSVGRLLLLQSPIVVAWLVGRYLLPGHGWMMDIVLAAAGCAVFAAIEGPRAFPQLLPRLGAMLRPKAA